MSGDVYISFGADTEDLEASLAVAKAQVSALSSEMRDLADQMIETGQSADSDIGQQMQALGGKLNDAKGHATVLREELKGIGKPEEGEEERVTLLDRVKESLEAITSPIAELKGSFSELLEIVAATFAVEKVAEWVNEITEGAEQVERDAAKLGVSLKQLQDLQGISKLSGTDFEELATIFERLQLALAKSSNEATPVANGLKALGVNAAELKAQNPSQQLETLSEAFSKFADGPTKTAAAIAIFGKAGADLIPILDKGSAGIEELRARFDAAGGASSDAMIAGLVRIKDQISELSTAWGNMGSALLYDFREPIEGIVKIATDLVEALTRAVSEGGEFHVELRLLATAASAVETGITLVIAACREFATIANAAVTAVAEWFFGLGEDIAGVVQGISRGWVQFFKGLIDAAGAAVRAVGTEFVDMANVATSAFHGDFAGAKAAFGAMGGDAKAAGKDIADALSGSVKGFDFSGLQAAAKDSSDRIKKTFEDAWNETKRTGKDTLDELKTEWGANPVEKKAEGGETGQVPAMNLGGKGRADHTVQKDAEAQAQFDIDEAKRVEKETQDSLNNQLKEKQITMTQWLTATPTTRTSSSTRAAA